MKLLFLGDIVARPGREVLEQKLDHLRNRYAPDFVIANGENAAGGLGIDPKTADEIFGSGVELITTGNHIWQRRELIPYLENNSHRLLRPANFPKSTPGKGFAKVQIPNKGLLGILNLQGRVFMTDLVGCPFREAESIIQKELSECNWIFVDFHCEATSEKAALAHFLDGNVSAVVGTHTHVQTADEKILPKGTAFITDVGMCGPYNSIIGVKSELIVERFFSAMPTRFQTASGAAQINGVLVELDDKSSKALKIERINILPEIS